MSARPLADSAAPTTSSRGTSTARGLGFMRPRTQQDHGDDHDLADEHVAPRERLVVTQPPMSGPAATAAAATPPMTP